MKPTENPWKECLEYVAITEIGLRRSNNQDSHDAIPARNQKIWNSRGHVFCVADGMGAHAAGELASKLATDTIPMVYMKQSQLSPPEALTKAIQQANHVIHTKGNSDAELHGMGTTNDTLVILPEGAMISHVGDSRVYRLRGQKWEQMTRDHSVIWDMEAAGKPIDDSVHKNVITRCLGVSPQVNVDIEGPIPLQVGDIFLLCSDGLCGQFEDSEMGKILSVLPLQEATRGLVDLANLRGGPDNITVITVKYLGPQQATATGGDKNPVAMAKETEMPLPPVPGWVFNLVAGASVALFLGIVLSLVKSVAFLGMILSVVALAVEGFGLWKIFGRKPRKAFTRRLGKGPYRNFTAVCDEKFAVELKRIFMELRKSAATQDGLDFQRSDKLATVGNKALVAKKYDEACKNLMLAISAVWRQLAE
ncbi:MAG: protein phosphatase 2C domain-containing protein [Planctomycetia bacterium]|nr:protein phosphatase 2C domain-containing protein [Planctomycetia bacterium]